MALTGDQERWIALIPKINHRIADHTKKLSALTGDVGEVKATLDELRDELRAAGVLPTP